MATRSRPSKKISPSQLIVALEALRSEFLAEIATLRAEVAEQQRRSDQLSDPNLDGQPRPPGNWLTIKQASFASGYSPSCICKWRNHDKILALKRGGRWLVNLDTFPPQKVRKC